MRRARLEAPTAFVLLLIGCALLAVMLLTRQSQVDACPFIDPAPLACRPDIREAALACGIVAFVVLLIATVVIVATSRVQRLRTTLRWAPWVGGAIGLVATAGCAITVATTQSL